MARRRSANRCLIPIYPGRSGQVLARTLLEHRIRHQSQRWFQANYDTAGYPRRDRAVANISLQTAVRLHQILGEASLDASASRSRAGLWSDATMAGIAARWGWRAA
jgi:hypothetical protein